MSGWNRSQEALDISGTYSDEWGGGTPNVVEQTNDSFTVRPEDGSWEPEKGRIKGSQLEIWSLKGTFADDKITWDNKSVWIRQGQAPKAPEVTAEAPEPTAEPPDPWAKAAALKRPIDVSGTYTDPWQPGARIQFKQLNEKLIANYLDTEYPADEGSVRGCEIEVWSQKAKFEEGKIKWENGNVWEPEAGPEQHQQPKIEASGDTDSAWQQQQSKAEASWGGTDNSWQPTPQLPSGNWAAGGDAAAGVVAAAEPSPEESAKLLVVSGTYSDPWQGDQLTVFKQEGETLTASGPDGSWGPEYGTVHGQKIHIFNLDGELKPDGSIKWENGGEWPRVSDAESPSGAPQRKEGELEMDEAQKKARWRDFNQYQDWYVQNWILPGKDEAELAQNDTDLFQTNGQSGEGIDFDLYDTVSYKISGPKSNNIPVLKSFDELFREFNQWLPESLVKNVELCGYKRPTPVQKFSIPAALTGRDIMCCAQTGSGKTAAYLIPILASMMKNTKATGSLQQPFQGPCKPDTLVICPTRELCLQIHHEAEKFCHRTGHRCLRIYGQEATKQQIEQVAKGGDLVISTPGRLWDFVSTGIIDVTDVNCLVLDEADRMMQMGMETTIRAVVEQFGMPSTENRQTLMFSATFPEECQKMAADYLYEHVFITVGVLGGAVCTVEQKLLQVPPDDKFQKLDELLNEWLDNREKSQRMLVFTNSKLKAKGLDEQLYDRNVDTGALHGDLTQLEREANLQKFRDGDIEVLIATDLASRGLDISGISHVINYDLPYEAEVYVQRIGRTGRIGHRGCATTFIAVDESGNWHDKTEVLQALPGIMKNDASGCVNEVPEWLTSKLEALQNDQWYRDNPDHQGWSANVEDAREEGGQSAWSNWRST